MLKAVLLLGGHLGALVLKSLLKKLDVVCIFTDNKSAEIISICENEKLNFFVGNPRTFRAMEIYEGLPSFELLLSVNYLFIVNEIFIQKPTLFPINVHGSLLPKYRGRTPHVWAIINGESETGITAHIMETGVDTGPVIDQIAFEIHADDTGASLLEKYKKLYPDLLNKVLDKIASNTVTLHHQDHSKATYFGKRTPEHGRIDWNWQKERIRNWIRAQAFPYPGAFFYYAEKKIIVNEACYSDEGFLNTYENGRILAVLENSLIVKTSNGALSLNNLIVKDILGFSVGEVLK